jgi:hypothetical protein
MAIARSRGQPPPLAVSADPVVNLSDFPRKSEKSPNWALTWAFVAGSLAGHTVGQLEVRPQPARKATNSGGTKLCSSVVSASVSSTSLSITSIGSR